MNFHRFYLLTLTISLLTEFAFAQTEPATASPWGVSSSASAFRNHAEWFPRMSAAGISTVRLFPEWRGFETAKGTWKFDDGDLLVKSAAANKIEINAVLMGSPPGTKAIHAFPMENLDDWANYTTTVVKRYQQQIRYWEVWNEGNGGFNDGKHTTADYAKLAATTYAAAKAADPRAQIGLTVASFDPAYLNQTILAQAKLGKPNSFDFLCIHPYEIADGLAHADGEIPFLWMTKLTRDVLKQSAPAKANAEIWITEVGRKLENKPGHAVNEVTAAKDFAKIYTMSIAQGISRVQWFEAQDPAGEEAGFGLLARDGKARPAFETLQRLTAQLGPHPKYLGWVTLGRASAGYGFLLQGKTEPVLVAWMPVGMTLKDALPTTQGTNVVTGEPAKELDDVPVMFTKVPPQMIATAQGNVGKNFPWGGDFSAAKTVSVHLGRPNGNDGIFQTGNANCPSVTFPDGSTGILVRGDIGHPVSFFVHPSFATIHTQEYFVRATVRRVSAGNVGMNLLYEVADSQGRGAYANVGQWFGVKAEQEGWQTHTWHVKNACFAKMWGNDITIRPEQSVPFVIGKVEVSTEAFK